MQILFDLSEINNHPTVAGTNFSPVFPEWIAPDRPDDSSQRPDLRRQEIARYVYANDIRVNLGLKQLIKRIN